MPNTDELVQWLNEQAQTPLGSLLLVVLIYGARLMVADLMKRLDRPKKKKRKAAQNG